jgi:hypothetical protein
VFIGLDKNTGSLVYFNLDAMLGQAAANLDLERNANPFGYIDKFYGFG